MIFVPGEIDIILARIDCADTRAEVRRLLQRMQDRINSAVNQAEQAEHRMNDALGRLWMAENGPQSPPDAR